MSITESTLIIDGRRIAYVATAATTVVADDNSREVSEIFSVYYRRTDSVATDRPVVYAFDGGPGTAAVTLHLGFLGPRRVELGTDPVHARGARPLVNNPYSILDVADLVIVDPPGTGYSRSLPGIDARELYGYTADVTLLSRFVVDHLHSIGRSASPLILLGESYGGARACGMALHMAQRFDVAPSAVALFVPALDYQGSTFTPGNDLPYVTYLPTMAAVARFHGKVGTTIDLDRWLAEAERFAVDELAPALLRGGSLDQPTRSKLSEALAALTGLSGDFVERCNLRVSDQRFFAELLRGQRRTLSRVDCRVVGIDRDAAGEQAEHDAFTAFVRRAFSPAINSYLRDELGSGIERQYLVYNPDVLPWSYVDVAENRFLFPVERLRLAMCKHPGMKVFVASGYYDAAVPYFATTSALNRALFDPVLRENVTSRRYEAGHILYLGQEPARLLRGDLTTFVAEAVS